MNVVIMRPSAGGPTMIVCTRMCGCADAPRANVNRKEGTSAQSLLRSIPTMPAVGRRSGSSGDLRRGW